MLQRGHPLMPWGWVMSKIKYQSEETLVVRATDIFTYTWSPRSDPNKVLSAHGSLESITKVSQLLWKDYTVVLRGFRNTRTNQPFDNEGRPWLLVPQEGGYVWEQQMPDKLQS
jgi:hypothetical protein